MCKSSWWMILVALLTISAPTAFADSYSIVFSGGTTTPVETSISVPSAGVLDLGPITDAGLTLTPATGVLTTNTNPQTDTYSWKMHVESLGGGEIFFLVDDTTGMQTTFDDPSVPVVDTFGDGGTATIIDNTLAATPEPSSVALMLLGLGAIAGLMWKRRRDALRHTRAA